MKRIDTAIKGARTLVLVSLYPEQIYICNAIERVGTVKLR